MTNNNIMGVRKVITYPDLSIAIECLPEGFLFVPRQTFLLYLVLILTVSVSRTDV